MPPPDQGETGEPPASVAPLIRASTIVAIKYSVPRELYARLTQLAKAGQLALDVTDEGELRYRVASEEEEGGAPDVAARLDALRQGQER